MHPQKQRSKLLHFVSTSPDVADCTPKLPLWLDFRRKFSVVLFTAVHPTVLHVMSSSISCSPVSVAISCERGDPWHSPPPSLSYLTERESDNPRPLAPILSIQRTSIRGMAEEVFERLADRVDRSWTLEMREG